MRAGLMPLDPAAFDRECQARSKIAAGAAGIAKERAVDDSEEDAAVLHGLDAAGALHELACRGFRISERVAAPYVIPASPGPEKIDAGGVVRRIDSGRSIGRGDRAKFPPFTS